MVHPMFGPNRFKLGLFSLNADGGLALTKVPERWPATWAGIAEAARMADRAGLEFILPIARWKGFGGELNSRECSLRNADLRRRARRDHRNGSPGFLDRARADGAPGVRRQGAGHGGPGLSGGRAGLNIVCGWNPEEFALFGLPMIEDRYAQGREWAEHRRADIHGRRSRSISTAGSMT